MYFIKDYRSRKNDRMFYEEPTIIELNNENDWYNFAHKEVYPFTITKNSYYNSIEDDVNISRKNVKYIINICDCDLY